MVKYFNECCYKISNYNKYTFYNVFSSFFFFSKKLPIVVVLSCCLSVRTSVEITYFRGISISNWPIDLKMPMNVRKGVVHV